MALAYEDRPKNHGRSLISVTSCLGRDTRPAANISMLRCVEIKS
jgi:hypothetical protein